LGGEGEEARERRGGEGDKEEGDKEEGEEEKKRRRGKQVLQVDICFGKRIAGGKRK
jgi:hypothetical protein